MKMLSSLFVMLFLFESAFAQTFVRGVVTGARDRRLPLANVSLSRPGVDRTIETIEAGRTGEFRVTIRSKGIWLLRFSGVNHQDYTVAVYIDRPKTVHLDVRLAACRYEKESDGVKVLGNFNRWYPPSSVAMQKQRDGTFAAEIKTRANPVLYQLSGVTDRNIAGTMADRFVYDEIHG